MMKYLSHWNIGCSPFHSGSSNANVSGAPFFVGGSVEEGVARLSFLLDNQRQLGIVVGTQGVGKTALLRNLRAQTQRTLGFREMGFLSLAGLHARYLPTRILTAFQRTNPFQRSQVSEVESSLSIEASWQRIEDMAVAARLQGQKPVLLIDDVDVHVNLEPLHRILNLSNGFTCVMAVNERDFAQLPSDLIDHCELRVDLPPWDLTMTAEYFDWSLSRVQCDDIFEPQAIVRIHELGSGLPRRMLQLAELGLVAGAVQKASRIGPELIDQVASELPEQHFHTNPVPIESFSQST